MGFKMGHLMKFIFLFIMAFSSFANAADKYGSCVFEFDSEDMQVTWNMSMTGLEINGVENPKNKIYGNICKTIPAQKIFIRPTGKSKNKLINERGDGLSHVKIETATCIFDYYFGVKKDRFVTSNSYDKNCTQNNERASNNLSTLEMQSQKATLGGTQYYNVGCANKSSGTVHEENFGKASGTICARGGSKSISICKPKSVWSIKLAADAICS